MNKYNYERLGVMIDMSRNAVMSVEALKDYLTVLKKMGYNSVMLYTEDTYEVEGEPFFGYMRGRYSISELRELDDFAYSIGIELIPCIQTLAHLGTITRWGKTPMDMGPVLLTDDERTYEFIENMFKTIRSCFRTNVIHIGMDEAHDLGRGRHLDIHGFEPTIDIIKRHLNRVCEIAKKYGLEPLMWSDMFFRSWNRGGYWGLDKLDMPKEVCDSVPEGVAQVYWDYYNESEEHYRFMIENHKELSDNIWFAGGVWTWRGFLPNNRFSISSMKSAVSACQKCGIKNIFMTMWGDDGAECSRYSVLPALFYIGQIMQGNHNEESIKAKFQKSFGIDFDDFITLDLPNFIHRDYNGHVWGEKVDDTKSSFNGYPELAAKTALYSDSFTGYRDVLVKDGHGKEFAKYSKNLKAIAKKSKKWAYLFEEAAKLCDVLEYKYELGVKTRNAYLSDDKAELLRLANEDYSIVINRTKVFYSAFKKLWFKENKPHGFEIQDIRLGGLIMRTASCKQRLIDYAHEKISSIPELEEDMLELDTNGFMKLDRIYNQNDYSKISSVNVF